MPNFDIPPKPNVQEEQQASSHLSPEAKEKSLLADIYQDPNFVTLYRYENPSVPYDEGREGVVSKEALVGGWFTDNLNDLRTYIKMRQPGGKIAVVRIPKDQMEKYDATKNKETKEMDIEQGNFVVPQDAQMASRMEIALNVDSKNPKKFLMPDWSQIDNFIDSNLTSEKLIERASANI